MLMQQCLPLSDLSEFFILILSTIIEIGKFQFQELGMDIIPFLWSTNEVHEHAFGMTE